MKRWNLEFGFQTPWKNLKTHLASLRSVMFAIEHLWRCKALFYIEGLNFSNSSHFWHTHFSHQKSLSRELTLSAEDRQKHFVPQKCFENSFLRKIFRVYLLITIMVTSAVEDVFTDSWCDICLNFPYCFDKTKQTKSHGLDNGEYSYRSAPRSLLEVLLSQHLRPHRLLERGCRHL